MRIRNEAAKMGVFVYTRKDWRMRNHDDSDSFDDLCRAKQEADEQSERDFEERLASRDDCESASFTGLFDDDDTSDHRRGAQSGADSQDAKDKSKAVGIGAAVLAALSVLALLVLR